MTARTLRHLPQIWRQQCEAARRIRERFGTESALEYLIAEKLLEFAREFETHPEFASELLAFVREIRSMFTIQELEGFFDRAEHAKLDMGDDEAEGAHPDSAEERPLLAQRVSRERDCKGWVKAMILRRWS